MTTESDSPQSGGLGAAKSVYLQYLAVSDQISEDGGRGVEKLAPYVSATDLVREKQSALYLQAHGLKIVGASRLLKFEAQSLRTASGRVTAYACVDFSQTKVLNRVGKDVTPPSRADRQTSVAEFVRVGSRLVLNENKPWSGESIC